MGRPAAFALGQVLTVQLVKNRRLQAAEAEVRRSSCQNERGKSKAWKQPRAKSSGNTPPAGRCSGKPAVMVFPLQPSQSSDKIQSRSIAVRNGPVLTVISLARITPALERTSTRYMPAGAVKRA